jgi:pantetheine-phosphate adenylyltransferase
MGTTAVYLGTFDPVHNGHIEIVAEAARIYDEVVVLVSDGNPEKEKVVRLFSIDERVGFLSRAVENHTNVRVAHSDLAPVHYAKSIGANWIVRGLRDAQDAASEIGFSEAMRKLEPAIRVVWIRSYSASSSSDLKLRVRRGEPVDGLCAQEVANALVKKLASAV